MTLNHKFYKCFAVIGFLMYSQIAFSQCLPLTCSNEGYMVKQEPSGTGDIVFFSVDLTTGVETVVKQDILDLGGGTINAIGAITKPTVIYGVKLMVPIE